MSRLLRILALLVFLTGLAAAAVAGWFLWKIDQDLPPVSGMRELKLQEPLRVYSRDGLLMGEFGAERREPLMYNELPADLVHAFLAAEDDRFFRHPGVDWQGLVRAAALLIMTGEKSQGGSTITMQLARNYFLSNERTYIRKLREILLALKIEKELSKEEILQFYLNKIFLGHRAYGVGAAAQIYYSRELDELTLAETAMIAGLPKAPSRFNPIADPDRAKLRRNYVLRRMRELDYITPAQYDEAVSAPITARIRRAKTEVPAHYAAEMVRAEIVAQYGTDAYTEGLQVWTTIDSRHQDAAVDAVHAGLLDYDRRHDWRGPEDRSEELAALDWRQADPELLARTLQPLYEYREPVGPLHSAVVLERAADRLIVFAPVSGVVELPFEQLPWPEAGEPDALDTGDWIRLRAVEAGWELAQLPAVQGALVAIEPRDGAISALVGGFDYFRSKFNRAAQAQRQPGSSFKPVLYSAALEHGYHPASIINDAPVVFDDPALEDTWRPENYSGRFYGPTRLRTALINSRNLVSIRLLQGVGIRPVREHARQFGFDLRRLPRDLSMSLGSGTFTPLEMAAAYAVFANGGHRIEPYLIREIRDLDGNVVFAARPPTVCTACEEAELRAAEQAELEIAAADTQTGTDSGTDSGPAVEPEEMPLPEDELPRAERVISAENAFLMYDLMRDVVQRGTARKARALGRSDLAGKTGTTNDQRDAWFCGFNASLVTTAWVGFDDLTPLGRGEVGGKAALPVWMDFMRVALDGQPESLLPRPSGIVTAKVNPTTGLLARAGSRDSVFEIFIDGHLPELEPERAGNGGSDIYTAEPQTVIEDLF